MSGLSNPSTWRRAEVRHLANRPNALYRLFDADDRLLYVGISHRPQIRIYHHSRRRPWWTEVRRQVIEWHPNRTMADLAETLTILVEEPQHNNDRGPSSMAYLMPFAVAGLRYQCCPEWGNNLLRAGIAAYKQGHPENAAKLAAVAERALRELEDGSARWRREWRTWPQ